MSFSDFLLLKALSALNVNVGACMSVRTVLRLKEVWIKHLHVFWGGGNQST